MQSLLRKAENHEVYMQPLLSLQPCCLMHAESCSRWALQHDPQASRASTLAYPDSSLIYDEVFLVQECKFESAVSVASLMWVHVSRLQSQKSSTFSAVMPDSAATGTGAGIAAAVAAGLADCGLGVDHMTGLKVRFCT